MLNGILSMIAGILLQSFLSFLMFTNGISAEGSMAEKRDRMVEHQIRARGIRDPRVLKAMEEVPRHEFVDDHRADEAYNDHPLAIGHAQTISQPYIVAYMSEKLQLKGHEKVLEIGTGSGYQAAVLARLAGRVFSIEIICELEKRAAKVLRKLKYDNVQTKCADGYLGWPEYAPFNAIILTAAPREIPQPLIDQLETGGRLIAPVGDSIQELVLIRKTEDGIRRERLIGVRFVPMTGRAEQKPRQYNGNKRQ